MESYTQAYQVIYTDLVLIFFFFSFKKRPHTMETEVLKNVEELQKKSWNTQPGVGQNFTKKSH